MPKVTIEPRGKKLLLRWKYNGKRDSHMPPGAYNNPLGRAIANDVKTTIEREMQAGTFDPLKYKPRVTGRNAVEITPAALITKFGEFKLKEGDIGQRSFGTRYQPLAIALEKRFDIPCHKISLKQAKDFAKHCETHLTAGTAKGRIWLLSSAWEWGKKRFDLGNDNPWDGLTGMIKKKPQRKQVKPFTREEIAVIKAALSESKYEPVVVMLFSTGARCGEIFGLRWCDVSEDFQSIWIRNAVSRGVQTGTTKTGTHRQVPLNGLASQVLRDRHNGQDPESLIFPGVAGNPIKDQTFRTAWRRVLNKAGVEYRSPRNIRPSVITLNRLRAEIDPVAFAEICGHSLRTQDEIYRRAVENVEFLEL